MSLIYDDTKYTDLIKLTSNGVEVANYTTIRKAITNRMKEIFGANIDLSTGTADGQVVDMAALIVNNMLASIRFIVDQLNPDIANGKFLDNICALSNVVRKQATASQAELIITYNGTTSLSVSELSFIDQTGTIWYWSGSAITLTSGSSATITATCSEKGPIGAPEGWIVRTVENLPITVEQTGTIVLGKYTETDVQLRARRNNSLAIRGTTVLESLKAGLLRIDGVDDVYILNNDTAGSKISKDGLSIGEHAIYICIRYATLDNINERIGTTIYEKLTPGVQTTSALDAEAGTQQSYNYDSGTSIVQTVYWKKCTPVHPTITFSLTELPYFNQTNINEIGKAIIEKCNNLPVGTNLDADELKVQLIYSDTMFRGKPTYTVNNCKINNLLTYVNQLTYYDYTTVSYNASSKILTIS